MDPSTFEMTDAELPEALSRYVPAEDVATLVATVRRSSPGASAAEVFFTLATARG